MAYITHKIAKILLLSLLCAFSTVSNAQDQLTLEWGDANGWVNVDNLTTPNQATMNHISGDVQLRATAIFSGQGTSKDRTITVDIPRGYRIVAYSATSGTFAISGVSKLELSPTDEAKFTSCALTARDGTPFANQLITGYATRAEGAESGHRPYDGKVVYTFNSTCDRIVLILTLRVDMDIIPHTNPAGVSGYNTSYALPDITVAMASGSTLLSNHVNVLFDGLSIPRVIGVPSDIVDNGHSGNAAGVANPLDPTKGTCDFGTGLTFYSYNAPTNQYQFIEEAVITISYPQGVTYKGFRMVRAISTDQSSNPALGVYLNGHLTVSNDAAGRKMIFTFRNIRWWHDTSESLQLYWTADVDNSVVKWDQELHFDASSTITSGALIPAGSQYTYTQPPQLRITRTPKLPTANLGLTAVNHLRRDLNAAGDFPYDWQVGQFKINNSGPSIAENVKYEFTFPSSPQVRGVRIPVAAGTTDENVRVTGLTSKGRTLDYTFDLGSITYGGHALEFASSSGIIPEILELADDEYLVNLSILQETLQVVNFNGNYTSTQTNYYGKFINGQEGDVTLTLSADGFAPVTATDHTRIGWTNSGAGTLTVFATSKDYPSISNGGLLSGDSYGGEFYPGSPMYFEARHMSGSVSLYGGTYFDITDPVFYINLPKGIDLDATSLQVISSAGANGPVFIPVSITGVPQTKIAADGYEWTSYRVEANNKYDMIARSNNNMDYIATTPGMNTIYADQRNITLRFMAYVSSTSKSYAVIAMRDVVNIDLGQTAISATSSSDYTKADENDWAGKGTGYKLEAQQGGSYNINIVQKPGLQVYLGIRVAGSAQDYYIYDGSPASIANISRDTPAEVWVKYENTSTDVYYAGSEIYLPVPKKNIGYEHYFNNTSTNNPAGVEDAASSNMSPQWTAELMDEVSLPGFTTYYGVSTSTATNWTGGAITPGWTPVTTTWYTYDELTAASYTLKDVTLMKFVAMQDVAMAGEAGSLGETSFRIVVGEDASLGQMNYWRSYQKGWREPDGSGSWVYGSVVAATPAMSGVVGKFFRDLNRNGILDSGEEYSTSSPVPPGYGVLLSGTGITGNIVMPLDAEGNFRSLDESGLIYYLRPGNYTVTVTNSDPAAWHITDVTSPTRSYFDTGNDPAWFNDIPQGMIQTDNSRARFSFSVTDLSTVSQLVGVGIKALQRYIPVNPHVSTGWTGR